MPETTPISQKQSDIWKRYQETFEAYIAATGTFFTELNSKERVEVVRWAFENQQVRAALEATELMKVEERKELVDILIGFTYSAGRWREFVTKLILEIPHDWLVENIEKYTEPILNEYEDYTDYSGFLWVLHEIDQQLAIRLAERAARSTDYDIREIGEYYLNEYLTK
jgi:hypothetical protein